jgi:hypothetical protein
VCDLIEPLFNDPKEEIFGELITRAKPNRRKQIVDDPKQRKISDMWKVIKK